MVFRLHLCQYAIRIRPQLPGIRHVPDDWQNLRPDAYGVYGSSPAQVKFCFQAI